MFMFLIHEMNLFLSKSRLKLLATPHQNIIVG